MVSALPKQSNWPKPNDKNSIGAVLSGPWPTGCLRNSPAIFLADRDAVKQRCERKGCKAFAEIACLLRE